MIKHFREMLKREQEQREFDIRDHRFFLRGVAVLLTMLMALFGMVYALAIALNPLV